MFKNLNASNIFGKTKKKTNETLNQSALKKVTETKALLLKGDWDTAELLINDLIRKHPYNADCCWLFGRLCAKKGQYSAAIFHFKQCIQLCPAHADCYCTYGTTLGLIKKYDEEEKMYKQCLEIDSSHHICHFNYANLCEMRSDYKNAEKHFKQAIEGHSKDAKYYIQYGILLKNVRRYDEAQKNFEIAKTLDPNNPNSFFFLSKTLQAMGHINEAITNLQKACKLQPSNKEYQRVLHGMIRSRPRPQIRKSESVYNNNICATPDGLNQSYSSNDSQKKSMKKQRSYTEDNLNAKLESIKDNEVSIPKPPSVILDNFSDKNAPGTSAVNESGNDVYFEKALKLYNKQRYSEAESIIKIVIGIKPNHKRAQKLYSVLSQKLSQTSETETQPVWMYNGRGRERRNTPTIKEMADSKIESKTESTETKMSEDPCQIEFIRFLEDRVKIGKKYPDLYDRFEKLGYDDIRYLFDFDIGTLQNELGIKLIHCKAFMRKIEVFKTEADVFRKWLKRIVAHNQEYSSMDGLIDRLENKGILTFEALYRYVLQKQDLVKIIGKEFHKIHEVLWREIENQQNDLMESSTANPAFAMETPGGNGNGNNGNNGNVHNEGSETAYISY